MKTNELNMNELKQVNGGTIFGHMEKVLRTIFREPAKPAKPSNPTTQQPVIARGKC